MSAIERSSVIGLGGDSGSRSGSALSDEARTTALADRSVSLVIPAYNEEALLEKAICDLIKEMSDRLPGQQYEILLVENGSRDKTPVIAKTLEERLQQVRSFSLSTASYGNALRHGILQARFPITVLFNADLWDLEFLERSLVLLRTCDIVVGSKRAPGAKDLRGANRRLATSVFNMLLRFIFGYSGTDTHGMKVLRTECVVPIIKECVTDREVFDTEIMIRAQRAGLVIGEVPVEVREYRPTRYSLAKRLPGVFRDLMKMYRSLKRSAG